MPAEALLVTTVVLVALVLVVTIFIAAKIVRALGPMSPALDARLMALESASLRLI